MCQECILTELTFLWKLLVIEFSFYQRPLFYFVVDVVVWDKRAPAGVNLNPSTPLLILLSTTPHPTVTRTLYPVCDLRHLRQEGPESGHGHPGHEQGHDLEHNYLRRTFLLCDFLREVVLAKGHPRLIQAAVVAVAAPRQLHQSHQFCPAHVRLYLSYDLLP
jgi:hypothetical protein